MKAIACARLRREWLRVARLAVGTRSGRIRRGYPRHSRAQGRAGVLGGTCGACGRDRRGALRLCRLASAPSGSSCRTLTLSEQTLERLDSTRPLMRPATAREFGIAASEVIRDYIEKRFDVVATQRTTEEFLQTLLQSSNEALARHRSLLGGVLAAVRLRQIRGRLAGGHGYGIAFSKRSRFRAGDRRAARRMIRFLQPEWFWALTVLPLVILWRGRRGPVAAVEYSDVSLARDVARRTRSRDRWDSLVAADHRGGSHDRRLGPAAAHSQSH